MDNVRDYIENITDVRSAAREWQLTEEVIDWAQTRSDVMEKLRQSYQKNGSKIKLIGSDKSFYRPSSNTVLLNMKEDEIQRGYELADDGNLYPSDIRYSFVHELEHSLQDNAAAPIAPLLEAGDYVREKYPELVEHRDELGKQIYSRTVDRKTGNQLLVQYQKAEDKIRLHMLEYLEQNPEYMEFIERYEAPAVMAERRLAMEEGRSPRVSDYLESGRATLSQRIQIVGEENIAPYAEKVAFMLNSDPAEDVACPVAGESLEAINREQTTLKEAGVSPAEDLSGCLLLVPDNTADNKPYRQAAAGRALKLEKD